jgi:3-oxoacyl-[acyl-carrier protein] reductase
MWIEKIAEERTMIDPGLHDRVVLITGANHGIGAATARAFATQGARVAVHYLMELPPEAGKTYTALHVVKGKPAAEALVDEIVKVGGRAMSVEGDLTQADVVPGLFEAIEVILGPVDVLVNNAAHCEDPDTLLTTTPGSLDRTFAVNTRAVVLMAAEFTRRFQQRKGKDGRIINLSTDEAQVFAGQIAYGASKAATEAFTRSLAIELGPLGITVNTVAPGPTQTGWMSEQLVARVVPDIPMGRVGYPEDIADAIVFIASQQARWLTGQVLKVSGGHSLP